MYKSLAFIALLSLPLGCSSSDTGPSDNSIVGSTNGQTNNGKQTNNAGTTNQNTTIDYSPYNGLLASYVDNAGQVDYISLKANDSQALVDFVKDIGDTNLGDFSDDEKLAFYINAYNAIVLNQVVEAFPIDSVMDISGFFDTQTHKVAGEIITLDALENEIIRPTFDEPRVHFSLVCAAKSCPPLQKKAYRAEDLDATLSRVTTSFIVSQTSIVGKVVTTSKIFDWFGEDFVKASGSVGKFLGIYVPADKAILEANDTQFEFSEYNWALNVQN